jgi:hypothetical protein
LVAGLKQPARVAWGATLAGLIVEHYFCFYNTPHGLKQTRPMGLPDVGGGWWEGAADVVMSKVILMVLGVKVENIYNIKNSILLS